MWAHKDDNNAAQRLGTLSMPILMLDMMFAPPDVNSWLAFLTPLAVAALTVVNIINAKMGADRGIEAKKAADEVKETLATHDDQSTIHNNQLQQRLHSIQQTSDDTHTLVNNNMAIQLQISATALRRLAELTQNPDDAASATEAETGLAEHVKRQAVVDDAIEARKQ